VYRRRRCAVRYRGVFIFTIIIIIIIIIITVSTTIELLQLLLFLLLLLLLLLLEVYRERALWGKTPRRISAVVNTFAYSKCPPITFPSQSVQCVCVCVRMCVCPNGFTASESMDTQTPTASTPHPTILAPRPATPPPPGRALSPSAGLHTSLRERARVSLLL
jgi:hypothetical protein